jgi:hypothetical protein
MNKTQSRFKTGAALLSLIIVLAGCTTVTPIKKILDNPRDYSEQTVTISGTVTEVMGLVFLKYFVVRDKTGEITVITIRPLPNKGSEIRVTGTVREAFALGDKQAIVIVESEPKKPS